MGRKDIHTKDWERNDDCQKRGSECYGASKILLACDWGHSLTRWNLSRVSKIGQCFEMELWERKDVHSGSHMHYRGPWDDTDVQHWRNGDKYYLAKDSDRG